MQPNQHEPKLNFWWSISLIFAVCVQILATNFGYKTLEEYEANIKEIGICILNDFTSQPIWLENQGVVTFDVDYTGGDGFKGQAVPVITIH